MNCILREMNEFDLSRVLEWRNAEDVRNNMYTNHVISTDEHWSWWEFHKNNPRVKRLICELDGFSGFFASEFPGPGTIYLGQTLEFHSPITVGMSVEIRMRVLSHVGRRLLLETQLFAHDVLCVSGQATLLMPINKSQDAKCHVI